MSDDTGASTTNGPTLPSTTDSRQLSRDPAVIRVRQALLEQRATGRTFAIRGPAQGPTATAALLGVDVSQVARTTVYRAYDLDRQQSPLLVVASSGHDVDTVKLCEVLDLAHLEHMEANAVEQLTGFPVDGIAPVGLREPIETVVDVALSRCVEVWVTAGHPRAVFSTTYGELLRITAGHAAEVG
ncbi:YbaK/EbsC family protein [Luteipulveratus sp. YIM 133132]|uniref:YbaK/EbsC family protein n=1 Tax=Luteipulveratus flavus TaxID=3031728 RepID=UPI0023AF424B|nr:YbaK/EbsC family protein [Luteipulveratus sp. YIM 133132]MDE9366775.1 YbaK/EbsC family protein [Luteipulveratus sp. YIM 133132]